MAGAGLDGRRGDAGGVVPGPVSMNAGSLLLPPLGQVEPSRQPLCSGRLWGREPTSGLQPGADPQRKRHLPDARPRPPWPWHLCSPHGPGCWGMSSDAPLEGRAPRRGGPALTPSLFCYTAAPCDRFLWLCWGIFPSWPFLNVRPETFWQKACFFKIE